MPPDDGYAENRFYRFGPLLIERVLDAEAEEMPDCISSDDKFANRARLERFYRAVVHDR